MDQSSISSPTQQVVTIPRGDRWQVYQRLQELEIPCSCSGDGYLQVEVNTPAAALQLWSVVQQLQAPRRELIFWLRRCWQQKA
jgi:hypothetical protein